MTYRVEYPDETISLDNEPWEFYLLGVWDRPDGYYISTDSGCSCPTPFESHTKDDLTGPLTWDQVKEEARSLATVTHNSEFATGQVEEFINEKENN